MTSIGLIGAGGRMGQAIVRCARKNPDAVIAAAIERHGHPAIGRDVGELAGIDPVGVTIGDQAAQLAPADVVVDFTFHSAVPDNARAAGKAGKAFVLGTTGLTEDEADAVRDVAATVPVVWAPNMSVGVNILLALVRDAAARLDDAYDIEIIEAHHRHKQDAPSGTALGLAREAAAGRGVDLDAVADYGRHGMTGEREAGRIGIHAVRGGDIVGDHTVIFAGEGERLELTHRAASRDVLAAGAVRAAVWVSGKPAGLYTMQDVLGITPAGG